jgi:zinc protease
MKSMFLAAVAAFALAPIGTAAVAEAPAIAPLNYQSRTLPNGLQVYSLRDPTSANVSVQVWYDVGSRDDPRGRSGFAHLFEHLMFKQTRNLMPEQFDRLTEDVGGYNNASTNDDFTNYFEVVPANHLQRLLWAEAERMRSLVIEPKSFASERDVVKEELRSRVLAAPYGKLFYLYLPEISYDVHPYARPGIGSIEDLDAATIDDVRAFHATYYRPDNAVLLVSGNFDQAELDRWVDQYFQSIARPSTPVPRVTVKEPARTAARSYTVYEPNTPLPAVMISYPSPPSSDPDAVTLEVLDAILSRGDSSRLHDSLVYRERLASEVGSFFDAKQGRGNLGVFALLSGGKDAATGEASLRRQIARFRDAPVTAAELKEAKTELLTAALRERETVAGRADELARAIVLAGDAKAADQRLKQIASVTPADIQRVARKWLRDDASASVRYLPEDMQKGAKEDVIATSAKVQTAALVPPANIKIWQAAPDSKRMSPPPPGPEVTPTIPKPAIQKLSNGLSVITVEKHDLPLVTAMLVAGGGSTADAANRAGTAALTSAVITEGTATRSATEVDRDVEALGASLGAESGWDGSELGLTVGTAELDKALGILADVARNAAFPAEEIERQRTVAIDSVKVAMSDPGSIAQMAALRALYGDGAYGHPASGTAESLHAIGRGDLEAAYRSAWEPHDVTLVLSGDISPAQARALAERSFGSWQGKDLAEPATANAGEAPLRGKLVVVDMPGSGQAAVAIARKGVSRSEDRYYPALVANAVLGGGYSARLNQEIRIKRGLSYGSGSSLDARREGGPFVAITQTRNDAADQVVALTLGEMAKLGSQPVSSAELTARRSSLTGGFGRNVETTSGIANVLAGYIQRGVPPETIDTYLPSVLKVSPADVQTVASDLLRADGATVVVVGDAKQFGDKLKAEHPDLVLIPLKELDLNSASLRKAAP